MTVATTEDIVIVDVDEDVIVVVRVDVDGCDMTMLEGMAQGAGFCSVVEVREAMGATAEVDREEDSSGMPARRFS